MAFSSLGADFILPISKRSGNFLSDNFFEGFQNDFNSAMQNVMSRYSGRSLLADKFANFRNLSRAQPTATTIASADDNDSNTATITDAKDKFTIILDLSEYVNGSISVKTRGFYAVVEASFQSKRFNRKYLLPKNTNIDGVKSAMSDDGILTIVAPKVNSEIEISQDDKNSCTKPIVRNDKGEIFSSTAATDSSTNELDKSLSIARKGNFFQDKYFENLLQDFESAVDDIESNKRKSSSTSTRVQSTSEQKADTSATSSVGSEAVTSEETTRPQFSRFNSYRNLREWAPVSETQACTLTKEAHGYTIVMDVKNFVGAPDRDINIKGAEGALTVTGSRGPISFKRDFDLPGLKDPNQIEATMSEDGILTIRAKVN